MKTIFFLLMGALSLPAQGADRVSGQERGGGKQAELEFVEIAQVAIRGINGSQKNGEVYFQEFDLAAFGRAMEQTEVQSHPNLCETKIDLSTGGANTRCLDARYLPDLRRIEVSEAVWPKKTCLEKVALAVHEYGRAAGLEDGNYKYSSRVRKSIAVHDQCDLYERDIKASCRDKVGYLRSALAEYDKLLPARKDRYLVMMERAMHAWFGLYGNSCVELAEEACLGVCTGGAGPDCFKVCKKRL